MVIAYVFAGFVASKLGSIIIDEHYKDEPIGIQKRFFMVVGIAVIPLNIMVYYQLLVK